MGNSMQMQKSEMWFWQSLLYNSIKEYMGLKVSVFPRTGSRGHPFNV